MGMRRYESLIAWFLATSLITCGLILMTNERQSHLEKRGRSSEIIGDGEVPDDTSYSNLFDMTTNHFHLDIQMDFTKNEISGTQTLYMQALRSGVTRVDLDIDAIQVLSVTETRLGSLQFAVNFPDVIVTGEQLQIFLPEPTLEGDQYTFVIVYSVQNSSASSWLTPEQTASKVLPYMYTQCESTYCRSLAPFQDSPVVKSTYSANVTVFDPIQVHLSANLISKTAHPTLLNYTIFSFRMDIPIPSYLFTIVAGNVVERSLGQRTGVISEPTYIDKYAEELSDLELYLDTLENYTIPYVWGSYKIVIMPPSFPFGGMENPLVTFASPSIITGDKSGVAVAIHEIAHSWTGNLVTCKNWRNLWINEGLTVYLERQTDMMLFGEDYYLVDATVGNDTMVDDMIGYGMTSNYTSLHPYTMGTNPDDSFSNIPYEKGFQFMAFLESLVGKQFLQGFLRVYLDAFQYQSVDYLQFEDLFIQYVTENNAQNAEQILSQIDWDVWINGVGLPPVTMNFYTQVITEAKNLAQAYINLNGQNSPPDQDFFNTLSLNGKSIFLQYLYQNLSDLTPAILQRIDQDYDLSNSNSFEILWRWFRITILSNYMEPTNQIHTFLGSIGRLKMIQPVYQALIQIGQRDLALQYFQEYQDFYHPIAVLDIQKLLGL